MQLGSPLRVLELSQWQSMLQSVCGYFQTVAGEQVIGHVDLLHCGQADFALVQHNARQIVRDDHDISRDGGAYYFLIIQLAGQAELVQGKSRVYLQQVGDMALIDSTRPSVFSYDPKHGSSQLSLHLPRELLHSRYPRLYFDSVPLIPAGSEYGQLLNAHIRLLLNSSVHSQAQLHLSNALLELVCARFASGDGCSSAIITQKNLHYLLGLIHEHVLDDGFNVQRLAALSGMSTRSIQRLFAAYGQCCNGLIQHIRLGRFVRALERCLRQGGKVQVAGLAYAHGFGDVSTLNRLFRQVYGESPTAYCAKQGRVVL